MKFTVLGGSGFIGSTAARALRAKGHTVDVPQRDTSLLLGQNLGHVIYAIGLTGNFRQRPHEAIEAHVNVACRVLQNTLFDSFLYLSSTRVYGGLASNVVATETSQLVTRPSPDSLYDISKLLGEAVTTVIDSPTVRVARLSNVYGPGQSEHTFLGAVVKEIRATGKVTIHDDPLSSKDYVSITDVVELLEAICLRGATRLYNVASGTVVSCAELAGWFRELGYSVNFAGRGAPRTFPQIDISRIADEFSFQPRSIRQDLPSLL